MGELLENLQNPLVFVRALEPFVFIVSMLFLVWISLPNSNPFWVILRPLGRGFTRRNYFLFVMVGLAVILIDVLLTAVDHEFTKAVIASRGEDFTSMIWRFEGSSAAIFQRWMWMPLTWLMAWAYVILFPALVPWGLAVFDWLADRRRCVALLIGYISNYLLALPFYLFFPVRECHVFYKANLENELVRLGLDQCNPALMIILRPMSGVDNCFPSFHTSLSVTVALFAIFSGRRRFAVATTTVSSLIILSTLYLGIHWIIDVLAGVAVGAIAYLIGEFLAARFMHKNNTTPSG